MIFPDLICAENLDTSLKFLASASGKPIVVRIHGNLLQQKPVVTWFPIKEIFPDLIWAQHLKMSRQFMDSVSGMPLLVRIHDNLSQQ